MKPGTAFRLVRDELSRIRAFHPSYNTAHEGHSVIREEFDELWDLIKANKNPHEPATLDMGIEAMQVAATAIRFMVDLCGETLEEYSARAKEMPEREG